MILKIFLKELKDTLRDKRTLMMMIFIPVLVFPIILYITAGISSSFEKEAATKNIKIGFIGAVESAVIQEFMHMPKNLGEFNLEPYADQATLEKDVKNDSLQMGLIVPNDYLENERSMKPIKCTVIYNATDLGISDRAEKYMDLVEKNAEKKRYKALELDEEKLQPIITEYKNIASKKEMIGRLAGGILPYVFIAFGFIGCMYPAIDLFTGEKERGTIETLLSTPVQRWKILIGKMLVVVLSGLTASFSALFGLFVSIEFLDLIPDPTLMAVVSKILTFPIIIKLFALLLPLTVFFAGIMIPISVYTKSFKEAQSIITPLNIVVVLPAMLGLFPGIELNYLTACIPILNIVLTTKSLIAGNLDYILLAISFLIMLSVAAAAVFVSIRQFGKETNILN